MALPTALAEDAPHFLRAVGVLPTAALLPAQGLDWIYEKLSSWNRRAIRHNRPADGRYLLVPLIAPLLIVFELATTTTDYFVRYAQADPVYHWFEGGPTELAGTMNAFLGAGWAGRRMQHGPSIPATIFIDQPLWETWASLPFLTDSRSIHFLPVDQPTETHGRLMFVTWPYRDWHQDVLAYLPHPGVPDGARGTHSSGRPGPRTLHLRNDHLGGTQATGATSPRRLRRRYHPARCPFPPPAIPKYTTHDLAVVGCEPNA